MPQDVCLTSSPSSSLLLLFQKRRERKRTSINCAYFAFAHLTSLYATFHPLLRFADENFYHNDFNLNITNQDGQELVLPANEKQVSWGNVCSGSRCAQKVGIFDENTAAFIAVHRGLWGSHAKHNFIPLTAIFIRDILWKIWFWN